MIRTRLQGGTPFFPNMLNNGKVEVCLKEDVDKTLTEKDKEIVHHKFKRCLAMAKWCDSENYTACWYHENSERCKWTEKWRERWLKLAEMFK